MEQRGRDWGSSSGRRRGGSPGVPTGHGGKLNPTSVSWLSPEVSSPPAVPGGTSGRERPVCRGGGGRRPLLLLLGAENPFGLGRVQTLLSTLPTCGGCGGQTMARQTWPKLKALFGHGSWWIPFWSAGVDNERSRQKAQTNTHNTGPVWGKNE